MGSMPPQHTPETLLSLAAKITEYAQKLTKELEEGKVPPVTLEADSPIKYERLPGEAFVTRQALEDALKDMWILSQGPSDSVFNYVHTVCFFLLEFLFSGVSVYTKRDRRNEPLTSHPGRPRPRMPKHAEPIQLLVRRAPDRQRNARRDSKTHQPARGRRKPHPRPRGNAALLPAAPRLRGLSLAHLAVRRAGAGHGPASARANGARRDVAADDGAAGSAAAVYGGEK
jgi:hypothetical protein